MENTEIKKEPSLLRQIADIMYKRSSAREKKELDRYNTIEFVDVNKNKKVQKKN